MSGIGTTTSTTAHATAPAGPMIRIDGHAVGPGHPVYVIGEIGLNHNGDTEIAKRLIDVAADAGAQAVKFQKRTPEISTPEHMKAMPRSTPWGDMTYLDYRYRVEFDREQYIEIGDYATLRGLTWFASPWDEPSVDFLEDLGVAAYKIASASVTDAGLLRRIGATGKPVILSTGMSTIEQIDEAVGILSGTEDGTTMRNGNGNETGARRPGPLAILHATSTYPLPPEEANLRMIHTLGERYPAAPIGYSGHETGLQISLAAVAIGATIVERHITLDRAMWGSDHAASLEPHGFTNLVRDIRIIETAMGDGVKRIFPGEHAPLAKLRRVDA